MALLSVWSVWILLFLLALFIFHSGVLFPNGSSIGAYLGYDNYYRFTTRGGAWDASHPLLNPLYYINRECLVRLLGESRALLLAISFSSLCLSIGMVTVNIYLRRILGVSVKRSLLLTSFLFSTFTVLSLSFTVETYPLSFCLLSVSFAVVSWLIKSRKRLSWFWLLSLSIPLGGITLTNFAKPLSALLCTDESWPRRLLKGGGVTVVMILLVVGAGAFMQNRNGGMPEHTDTVTPVEAQTEELLRFRGYEEGGIVQSIAHFLGQALLVNDLHFREVNGERVLRPDPYDHWMDYLLPLGVFLVLCMLLFVGRRDHLAWLPLGYFVVDVAVHFVGAYGMNEPIIFGGHWVFLVPIALAWLYQGLPRCVHLTLDGMLLALTLYMMYHNLMNICMHIPNALP